MTEGGARNGANGVILAFIAGSHPYPAPRDEPWSDNACQRVRR